MANYVLEIKALSNYEWPFHIVFIYYECYFSSLHINNKLRIAVLNQNHLYFSMRGITIFNRQFVTHWGLLEDFFALLPGSFLHASRQTLLGMSWLIKKIFIFFSIERPKFLKLAA